MATVDAARMTRGSRIGYGRRSMPRLAGRSGRLPLVENDDELTLVVGAADGASPLERDGMLRRLEEAVTLAIAELTHQAYLTSGSTSEEEIRLVIAAPGLASSEVLSAVGTAVAELIEDPEVPGWGPFSVNVTDESDDETENDDHDDDLAELFEDLEADFGQLDEDEEDEEEAEEFDPERARQRLLDDALHLTGLEPGQLPSPYVSGALFQSAVLTVDQLFEDLATLRELPSHATVASAPDELFWVLDGLPSRYANRYDVLFVQELIVAMVDVTRRFTEGWEPLACVGQELALRLILDQAEVQLELTEADSSVGVPDNWRPLVEETLFEDLDHEMLYDPGLDGIEDDQEVLESIAAAPMGFADWFRPFNPERHLPPYLLS